MFPLCYICFTKIVQFEKRNSGDVQLIFIFTYKYSERWVQRQAKFTFPAWLYRTAPMFYKYTNKRERSKTKLALILFSRAKVSSSFNSNIVKGECNGKRNLHFRLDSAEPYPIFVKDTTKNWEWGQNDEKSVRMSGLIDLVGFSVKTTDATKSQLKQEFRYYHVTLFAVEEVWKDREEMAVNYRNTAFREVKLG